MPSEQVEKELDYLSMSDEELLNAPEPALLPVSEEKSDEGAAAADTEQDTEDEDEDKEDSNATESTDDDAGTAAEEDDEGEEGKDEGDETPATGDAKEKTDEKSGVVDYEAEYKRLLAPFKANGREIQVQSVDDAITLMQMGANYNKKMAALKPNLKLMKMLENNGLLSEEKLSYLVELDKKNPDAINKLIKDSGLNPLDLDPDKAESYQPKIHKVDDRELDLDTVLDEIQDSPTYTRTLEIVSKQWDGKSKQAIAETPQLLKVINDHVARGIYDLISNEVERERMLGRLNGLSDIEAYKQVGDAIQARGGFNHLGSSQGKTPTSPVVTPKAKKADDAALKEKRRAAASSKPAVTQSTSNSDFNPLSLSDDEFEKVAMSKYR